MTSKQFYITEGGSTPKRTSELKPLAPGFVRVQTKAVGGNPIDLLHRDYRLAEGTGAGSDFSGVVIDVGSEVTDIKAGDTVATVVSGGDIDTPELAAFSTVVDAPASTLLRFTGLTTDKREKIPVASINSFEQASAIPLVLFTAALMVSTNNGVPLQRNSASGYVLIYGAGSSVGFFAIQLAKYVGYEVIVTASEKHKSVLKNIGADHFIDYHDEDWVEQVRGIAGDSIATALDTISSDETVVKVHEAISHKLPAKIHTIKPRMTPPPLRENVTWVPTNVYWLLVARKQFGPEMLSGEPSLLAKMPELTTALNQVLASGEVKAPAIEVVGTSFEEIPAIYKALEKGASANKFVVRL